MAKAKSKGGTPPSKHRKFTFLIYPDSAPEGWVDILKSTGMMGVISPLHDKDPVDAGAILTMDEAAIVGQGGTVYKKAHWHVMLISGRGPLTVKSMRDKLTRLLGPGVVNAIQVVDNVVHLYDYFCHETEDAQKKGKTVYPRSERVEFNNFDIDRERARDVNRRNEVISLIIDDIFKYKLAHMGELRNFVLENERGYSEVEMTEVFLNNGNGLGYIRMCFDGVWRDMPDRQERAEARRLAMETPSQ